MAENLGTRILNSVGGAGNVNTATYCATRLRMSVKDNSKVDRSTLEGLSGVLGVQETGGQLQVIIGPAVPGVYEDFTAAGGGGATSTQTETGPKGHRSIVTVFLDTVAGLFTPLLPLLAGAGVLRGLALLAEQVGWLAETDSTYIILTAASMAVFYFLPIMLAFTGAEKFKANKYIAAAIMGAMLMPDFLNMMGDQGNGTVVPFFGLPIVLMSYPYTVIPAILSVYVLSRLERLLRRIIPESLQMLFVSLLSLLIMVPLTAGVFGPFGVYLGEWISHGVNWLMVSASWAGGLVVGGVWNIFVIFGLQWAVNPVMIANIATLGHDYIVPLTAAANFGMAGAAAGFMIRTRDRKMQTFSGSALLSIFFAGITEPAIYGIAVKYRRPLVAAIIGGAAGGTFMAATGVRAYAFVFGGLTTIPAFVGDTLVQYLIGLAISFVVALLAIFVIGTGEAQVAQDAAQTDLDSDGTERVADTVAGPLELVAPVDGTVKDLAEASDPAFASGTMGPGYIVAPTNGKVVAPLSGKVLMVFETGHAFGIEGVDGTQVLVHIGVDTVNLGGKHFEAHITAGQRVKAGELCVTFDPDAVTRDGYDPTVIVVETTKRAAESGGLEATGNVSAGDPVFRTKMTDATEL